MVDIDAAVFLLASMFVFAGSGGEVISLDVALPSHENGFVGFREAPGGNCGERSRAGIDGGLGGAAHGTEGRAAENPWNRDGRGRGFVGGPFEGSASTVVVMDGVGCTDASSVVGRDSRDIRCAVSNGDAEGCTLGSSMAFSCPSIGSADMCSSVLVLGGSAGGLDVRLLGAGGGFESAPSTGELGASPLVSLASSNFCIDSG